MCSRTTDQQARLQPLHLQPCLPYVLGASVSFTRLFFIRHPLPDISLRSRYFFHLPTRSNDPMIHYSLFPVLLFSILCPVVLCSVVLCSVVLCSVVLCSVVLCSLFCCSLFSVLCSVVLCSLFCCSHSCDPNIPPGLSSSTSAITSTVEAEAIAVGQFDSSTRWSLKVRDRPISNAPIAAPL